MNKSGHPRSQLLYEVFIKDSSKPLPIIALTREPIGKNISSFFQNLTQNIGVPFERYENRIHELCDYFISQFDQHDDPIKWFSNNLERYIDLDVYDHRFDLAKGYSIIENNRFKVLILRSEESNETKQTAVKDLLELPEFKIDNENVGENKPYANLYREFQSTLILPASYVERMLNSRYTQHFYSADEIEFIRNKWRRRHRRQNQ